ncbi:MAG: DUF1842 domain-containing protein [Chloroflexi bacterium]|nr:DUF1842 domain-containing protein [Chloroflexota bacterium]
MADEIRTGLFPVSYEIGTGAPGAPLFTVHFFVNTPHKTVTGMGRITQTTNPPLDLSTKLEGRYDTVLIEGEPYQVVAATGYPVIVGSPLAVPGPAFEPNVYLHMKLSGDWQSGTATYIYIDEGNPHAITDVPAKLVPSFQPA